MRLLAFYLGWHDSNLCMYDADTGFFKYVKSERALGIKRHQATLGFVKECCDADSFVPDRIIFSDGNRNGLGQCPQGCAFAQLSAPPCSLFGCAQWYTVDHHLAHVMSAWPLVESEKIDFGIAIDGRGDHETRVSVFKSPAQFGSPIFSSTGFRICHLLDRIGHEMRLQGDKADFAGKVMGAQAYGNADEAFADREIARDVYKDLISLAQLDAWQGQPLNPEFFKFENSLFKDWLATIHLLMGKIVVQLFETYCNGGDTIVYAGGCALNTVINCELAKRFSNLIIPPHCYDGGLSLGCLEVLRIISRCPPFKLPTFPFIQSDEDIGYASPHTVLEAAQQLADGKIVGWIQGNGEIGPRALGHRSLLLNPGLAHGKELLNAKVKKREVWRPYGPSILHRCQSEYFPNAGYLPFMLHTVQCPPQTEKAMPSVVHVDKSSRIQSVSSHLCPALNTYEDLLEQFEGFTGIPAVLNTSYNAGGDPIIGTRSKALKFFWNSEIDCLVLGDEIIRKA